MIDPRAVAQAMQRMKKRQREYALDFYAPYPAQMKFHEMGAMKIERAARFGNRCGKSFCGAMEMAMHLTGLYPTWWPGRKFAKPVIAWAAGKSGIDTRDVVQKNLLGSPYGTGSIPKFCVDWQNDTGAGRSASGAVDFVKVTHHDARGEPDGKSELFFKTFDQGRERWQGASVDVVWMDEEADEDIYVEARTRLAPTRKGEKTGMIYTTFTPLLGKTPLLLRFMEPPPELAPDIGFVTMSTRDAPHIDQEELRKQAAAYPAHERDARLDGLPMLGEGKVFTTMEAEITEQVLPNIPSHWSLLWGIDPGVGHPFGAVLTAWDKDTDTIHIIHAIRMSDALPLQQAYAMKQYGKDAGSKIPVAWPQDATQRKEFAGELMPLASIYRKHGLKMLDHHATFVDGSNSTELGILDMQERMATGRLKVFSHLSQWFEEYREYHRKDGQIVKVRDDLMSATRVAVMAKRFARPVLYERDAQQMEIAVARDVDINPWA